VDILLMGLVWQASPNQPGGHQKRGMSIGTLGAGMRVWLRAKVSRAGW